MLCLIGSKALAHYVKLDREPADEDYLGDYDSIQLFIKNIQKEEKISAQYPAESGKKIILKTDKCIREFEICWSESDSEALLDMIMWAEEKPYHYTERGQSIIIPPLDVLFTLKMSHRYRKNSPHFLKTLKDINLMRSLGAKIPEEYMEWFAWREKETYAAQLPKLNQSKKDFFDNSNNIYTIDHDDIHEAVKNLDRPAYTYFQDGEVWCSKKFWDDCSEEIKLFAAYEEICVLSIERSIHPFPDVDRKWAFDMAQMKLSTSISSGWFREFVYDSYHKIQAMYNADYLDKFYKALYNGQIKDFKGAA